MKRPFIHRLTILSLLFFVYAIAWSQAVSNVTLAQEDTRFRIEYDLTEQIETFISVAVDNSYVFRPIYELSGNFGSQSIEGHNVVYWDALKEWGEFSHDVMVKVTLMPLSKVIEANGISFTMVYVQGGTFVMGATLEQGTDASENERSHVVKLSSYYISQTEVTQELWNAVMGENRSFFIGVNQPVNLVSYQDITTFISRLNLITGLSFNLPTEAQWEFAARGGKKSRGFKYAGDNNLRSVAWFGQKGNETYDNGNSDGHSHKVATKQPNELGLYDMSGNLWEWCRDYYGEYPNDMQTDPTGPKEGKHRVVRGGSFYSKAAYCRVSTRSANTPESRLTHTGFRLSLPASNTKL
ncbi:MAG: SUMF1/EgtB/PvdO family nonheme iron enzyme [Paludibacteraceae bacterium]|nr:SUMF1/EgtB/PvdO family nonheme iron enzyme [Paludibacteraceae bacterium]